MKAARTALGLLCGAGGLLLAAGIARHASARNPPAQPAAPLAVVTGVIVDSVGAPISHAVRSVVGLPLHVITDSAGLFRLPAVPAGLRIFAVRALGYRPLMSQVAFVRCERIGVYIDGFRLHGDPGENLSLINPADVEAMEIYRGASELPAEFMSDDCGAIVIWTRC